MQAPPPEGVLRAAVALFVLGLIATGLAHAWIGFEPLLLSDWLPGCAFRALTGLRCPGCGMTHALLLLTQLRVTESLAAHPAALVLVAAASLWLLRPEWTRAWQRSSVQAGALVVLIVLWVLRQHA